MTKYHALEAQYFGLEKKHAEALAALKLLLDDVENVHFDKDCPFEDQEHNWHDSVMAARAVLAEAGGIETTEAGPPANLSQISGQRMEALRRYLDADCQGHLRAHGKWRLDAGKLAAALEAAGVVVTK